MSPLNVADTWRHNSRYCPFALKHCQLSRLHGSLLRFFFTDAESCDRMRERISGRQREETTRSLCFVLHASRSSGHAEAFRQQVPSLV